MRLSVRLVIMVSLVAGLAGVATSPVGRSPRAAVALEGSPTATSSGAHGTFADTVDIGGRSLYLKCLGEGTPTVVLESGSPFMDTSAWGLLLGKLSQVTRVCAYDRANVGQSDPAPTPRTVQQMADDLHALLHTAGVPGPYVLTAVSFGPLVSRMYASAYPEDVAGLVLIEGVPEDLVTRWNAILPPELQDRWVEDFWVGNPEEIALEESYAQVRDAAPLPQVPLIVIVHGDVTRDDHLIPSGWPVEALDPIWKELVARQATLIPGGRLIVAEESGHSVEAAQPDLVVAAIEDVVEAVRDPSTWATSGTPTT